jgi:hypothetical protein
VQDAPAIVPRHELHWSSASIWAFSKSQATKISKRIKRLEKSEKWSYEAAGNGESTITYCCKKRRGTVQGDRRSAAAWSAVKALPPPPCVRFSAGWLPSWCKTPTNEHQSLQSMFVWGNMARRQKSETA